MNELKESWDDIISRLNHTNSHYESYHNDNKVSYDIKYKTCCSGRFSPFVDQVHSGLNSIK